MKEYYEKQVKQAEMERKFIINGIKAELFALSKNADADIKKEDLAFYAEMIEKVDSDLQLAKDSLSKWVQVEEKCLTFTR